MKSKIKVFFEIWDFDVSVEELSKILGNIPTRTLKKGDPVPHRNSSRISEKLHDNLVINRDLWALGSGLSETETLDAHIRALMAKISPYRQSFIRVCSKYPAVLSCVVRSYDGDRPEICFEPEVVREMSAFNASIDVDLYVLEESK